MQQIRSNQKYNVKRFRKYSLNNGSQVAADGGCERDVVHRMNEGYRALGALKSVLSNKG